MRRSAMTILSFDVTVLENDMWTMEVRSEATSDRSTLAILMGLEIVVGEHWFLPNVASCTTE